MGLAGNVLQRKLTRAGIARSPLPDTDFVGQTFARQIEKGLRPLVKTTIGATLVEARVAKVSEAIQGVSVPAMLGVVEIDGSKAQGLVILESDLAFHLTDLMLGGDPSAAAAPVARSFTPIDHALCRLAEDVALTALAEALGAAFGRPLLGRFAVVSQQQDVTQVRFAPLHGDVLVYNLSLDMGPAARTGALRLFLPLALLDVICARLADKAAAAPVEEANDLWRAQMRRAAAAAPVPVNAVLHSRRMAVDALMALRPGDMLYVPASAPQEIRLVITLRGGRRAVLAAGALGAQGDQKAVRLDAALDPALREELRRAL